MKLTEKRYVKKIAKLVEQYRNAASVGERALICLNANTVKSQCAKDLIKGKVSTQFYKELFKVGEANISHHFLEIWAEKI